MQGVGPPIPWEKRFRNSERPNGPSSVFCALEKRKSKDLTPLSRWIAQEDWKDVGPRFLEPIPNGKYKGFTIVKWLPDLVNEYYRLSGRHEKTGRPFLDTLRRLDLEQFKEWSQLD